MKKIKVMLIFGTRPETIKMAPVIKEIEKQNKHFEAVVVVTAQHREILDQPMQLFNIKSNYDLNIMTTGQSLFGISSRALNGLEKILDEVHPDIILVQGDTTTTFIGSLAGFYKKIPVGHLETGLRTYNKYNPYPEEINRQMTTSMAELHFPPTKAARETLLNEGIESKRIYLTGNTVIDALYRILEQDCEFEDERLQALDFQNKKVILFTTHRRESFGKPLESTLNAIEILVKTNQDVVIVFPIHYNPNVRKTANKILKTRNRILIIEPLDYKQFVHLMARSHMILTDSGGIQEEATALGKPTLILRETTERMEGIKAGTTKLVGTNISRIIHETMTLLNDVEYYNKMAHVSYIYGDGTASKRILAAIAENVERFRSEKVPVKEFHISKPTSEFPGVEFKGKIKNILTVNVEDFGVFKHQEIILDIFKTLEILEDKKSFATFFVSGWLAEKYPEVIHAIVNAGHEIAAQGYNGTLVYHQTPKKFRDDVNRTIDILQNIIDVPVQGYRAPCYSIIRESIWAWDILIELGLRYDSSVFPVKHDMYGIPNAPRFPFVVNVDKNGGIIEFPLSTIKVLNENIPIAGGGYLRFYPYWFIKQGIKNINAQEKPAIMYLRTWEMNPMSFRKGSKILGSFRKIASYEVVSTRIMKLLDDFEFVAFQNVL